MSIIVIVSICVAIAAVIGLRVYIEHKQDKELENLKQQIEEDKKRATLFAQEEVIAAHQPIAIEEQTKIETSIIEIETINSAAAQAETKPKKKKRYYGKRKPQIKKKQTKK